MVFLYKHHNTVQMLIGITPQAQSLAYQNAWGGRVRDKHITTYAQLAPIDLIGLNWMLQSILLFTSQFP